MPFPDWRLMPRRYATLAWILAAFVTVNMLVRVVLIAVETRADSAVPSHLAAIFGVGAVYDLAAASWLLIPFALLALVVPDGRRGRVVHGLLAAALALMVLFLLIFTAVAELVFWNEFSSRFNFIAVDYLIYTREVIGNIRESYPVHWILPGNALLAVLPTLWLPLDIPEDMRHARLTASDDALKHRLCQQR